MKSKVVTVIGSYNVGLFLKGEAIPFLGQTVTGDRFFEGGGGKGSNQAIAASKMGADTRFVGRIGTDKYGEDALKMYRSFGISTEMITIDPTIHTGVSVILINKDGQNCIMVVPGANFNLSGEDIDRSLDAIKDSAIAGFQLESNFDIVEYAIKKLHGMGIPTLLDPAPAMKLPDELYKYLDYIKPNEHEAAILSGIKVVDVKSAEEAGKWFVNKGVKTAIITLGKNGAMLVTGNKTAYFPAPDLKPVDTTGAGDTFSGALMAALSKGESIEDAIVFANCASAISVTRYGVVDAIPSAVEVEAFMKTL